MRKLLFVVLVAFLGAAAIGYWSTSLPYSEKLIRIQAEQKLGRIDKRILDEPLEVQALLMDYAGDGEPDLKKGRSDLVLKAWVALLKYPAQSREVLQLYGTAPEFQAILREHGETVIPVIKYFLVNDVASLRVIKRLDEVVVAVIDGVGDAMAVARKALGDLWDKWKGNAPAAPTPLPAPQPVQAEYGPTERGWYAIKSIKNNGHKFLGQFSLDTSNVAHWNQVDRVAASLTGFFTGGLSNLERKYEIDEAIGGTDVFFATIDVIPFVAAVKLLKAGRVVATTGKELSLVGKTRVFAARLIPKSPLLQSMGRFGVLLATGYVVLSHPGLLNSVFAGIANLLGLSPILVQFVGWFLLISIALYPFSWVLKSLARFVIVSFSWLEKSVKDTSVHLEPRAILA